MIEPAEIYVYKMTTDNGGAPCIFRGVLSLALCKPKIRRKAEPGSLLLGLGGKRLGGRLIYAALVTKKPELGRNDYYHGERFSGRPDRIYRDVKGKAVRRKNPQFHFKSDEWAKDVGARFERAHVLLSRDFRYFGKNGRTDYRRRFPKIAKVLQKLTQGHRVNHDPEVRQELIKLY